MLFRSRPNGEDQPGRPGGNGQAEADGVDARGGIEGQAPPVAGTGEQPREAVPDVQPVTPPRQAPAKARRRPKAASAEEPEPEAGPSEDSEPAET